MECVDVKLSEKWSMWSSGWSWEKKFKRKRISYEFSNVKVRVFVSLDHYRKRRFSKIWSDSTDPIVPNRLLLCTKVCIFQHQFRYGGKLAVEVDFCCNFQFSILLAYNTVKWPQMREVPTISPKMNRWKDSFLKSYISISSSVNDTVCAYSFFEMT